MGKNVVENDISVYEKDTINRVKWKSRTWVADHKQLEEKMKEKMKNFNKRSK